MSTTTTKRVVKALWAPYMVQRTTSRGVDILVPRYGNRGEEVELLEHDENRLDELGALEPKGAKRKTAAADDTTPPPATLDVHAAGVAEIAAFLEANEPTIPQTVEMADGDPALAEKLLEAESVATGGEPRKGVTDKLQKLIDDAAAE